MHQDKDSPFLKIKLQKVSSKTTELIQNGSICRAHMLMDYPCYLYYLPRTFLEVELHMNKNLKIKNRIYKF